LREEALGEKRGNLGPLVTLNVRRGRRKHLKIGEKSGEPFCADVAGTETKKKGGGSGINRKVRGGETEARQVHCI